MTVRLNTNLASLNAQRRLGEVTSSLGKTYERLASGLRITRASDDAAGLAVASGLNIDARVFSQSVRNVSDAVSALSIAESAAQGLSAIVTRIEELATQGANGAYSGVQRAALDREVQALRAEYQRIAETTEFNGSKLFLDVEDLSVGSLGPDKFDIKLNIGSELRRNVADGTFQSVVTISGPASYSRIGSAVDINLDGEPDLLFGTPPGGQFVVAFGNGNGTFKFSAPNTISSGNGTYNIGSPDLNGDGKPDIFTAGGNDFRIRISNGDGTFIAPQGGSIPISSGASTLGVADLNGDNLEDVILSATFNNDTYILLSNGNGTVRISQTITSSAGFNALGDFNNDGKIDFVTNRVFLGRGDGTFQDTGQTLSGLTSGPNWRAQAIDLNQDGVLDLVQGAPGGTLMFVGNSDGSFKASTLLTSSNSFGGSVAGDYDSDGDIDLVINGGNVTRYLQNNGSQTFIETASFSNYTNSYSSILATDTTGDGVIDLISNSDGAGAFTIAVGNSNQSVSLEAISVTTQARSLQAIETAKNARVRISRELGALGSQMSRLETARGVLVQSSENYKAAASQIMDADVATESAELVRKQILQQSAQAVLAQANQLPQLALRLIQGVG